MPQVPFPSPVPPPGGPTIPMDADVTMLASQLQARASPDYINAAQEVFTAWAGFGRPLQHGDQLQVGFTRYFAHQREPGVFLIAAPDYRGDAFSEQTDDLSEALWIHSAQSELADRTGTPLQHTQLDHWIDISPAARATLGGPGTFILSRTRPSHSLPSGATHSGWTITVSGETHGGSAVEGITGAEVARLAPALVTALALPMDVIVAVEDGSFRWVNEITRPDPRTGAGPSSRTRLTWEPLAPATVSYTAHGIEFFTEVDPEYRAEALQILQVVNQRAAEDFVDNYALNFGMTFLVFRTEGEGRMRVKTTDVSKPGTAHSTPDLTAAATLRRSQLEANALLGKPTWADVANCQVTMRVHPGALDGPQITMRRQPPDGNDSGWVFGNGSGEPQVLRAHEVRFRAPAVATYFPLPPGNDVTVSGGRLERVVDGAGTVIWPRP